MTYQGQVGGSLKAGMAAALEGMGVAMVAHPLSQEDLLPWASVQVRILGRIMFARPAPQGNS